MQPSTTIPAHPSQPGAHRIPFDVSTQLPSDLSFGQFGEFLRGATADEESRNLSASMGALASNIEPIIDSLRLTQRRDANAPLLMDLLSSLRAHRALVMDLSLPWRGMYEYASYLAALNNLRVLIGQWLLDGGTGEPDLALTAEDFQLVTWRTLGEGLLLIDMYEQWMTSELPEAPDSMPGDSEPRAGRANRWWKKLR